MLRLAGVSASARPFEMSGIALAMPPVPVLVPTPAPVRRNHNSSVKFEAFSAGAAPNVRYWLEPFSCTAWFEPEPPATADAGVDASDWLFEKSTATTT